MSFLFKPRQKTPAELVKSAKECLFKIEEDLDNKKASLKDSHVKKGRGGAIQIVGFDEECIVWGRRCALTKFIKSRF